MDRTCANDTMKHGGVVPPCLRLGLCWPFPSDAIICAGAIGQNPGRIERKREPAAATDPVGNVCKAFVCVAGGWPEQPAERKANDHKDDHNGPGTFPEYPRQPVEEVCGNTGGHGQ